MGWTYSSEWKTKQQIVEHLTRRSVAPTGHTYETIARTVKGNNLWTVMQHTMPTGEQTKFIVLFLLAAGTKREPGWGYKDIAACSGPYEVNCPLSYLEMAPCDPGEYEAPWRERVRGAHAHEAAQRATLRDLKIGDTIVLVEGCRPTQLVCTSVKPLLGTSLGMRFRINRKHVASVIPAASAAEPATTDI